ncbi:MAG: conjugal transfer protein TraX [Lachnospiraceae bacterium]|nr:conjugal transfer protein TraX [Lachnospiraceae bacterium]
MVVLGKKKHTYSFRGISGACLKNIAYLSMFIDHFFAVVFFAYLEWRIMQGFSTDIAGRIYHIGRNVGRIAFILFAFMAAEGFYHTHSRGKYLLRLGIFALLSEIPFDLAIHGAVFETNGQNVYFTLFLGVAALCLWEMSDGYVLLQAAGVVACCTVAAVLKTDYMFMGVLLIVAFYLCRRSFLCQCVVSSAVVYIGIVMVYMVRHWGEGISLLVFLEAGKSELYGLFAFVFLFFYRGRKGKQLPKACYYMFYPLHLLLLYGMKVYLFG